MRTALVHQHDGVEGVGDLAIDTWPIGRQALRKIANAKSLHGLQYPVFRRRRRQVDNDFVGRQIFGRGRRRRGVQGHVIQVRKVWGERFRQGTKPML